MALRGLYVALRGVHGSYLEITLPYVVTVQYGEPIGGFEVASDLFKLNLKV